MGRIRTVKPELQQQPWFATLSDAAARTYFGLLGVVDDCGRCAADPLFIGGQIFWGRQRSAAAITRQLAELEAAGIIRRYRARGGMYLEIVGWSDKGSAVYQQINKPQGERFPAPESIQYGNETGHESGRETVPDPKRSETEHDPIPDLSHHAHAIPPVPAQQVAHVPAVPHATPPATHQDSRSVADRDPKPSTVTQPAGYNPDDPRARGRLAEATYRRVSDARLEVAKRLGLPEPLPFPVITPGRHPLSMTDLQDRIREEGPLAPVVCDRIVANLTAQAIETRALEWLAEKFSAAGPWRTAKDWQPGAQRPRAGPFGSAGRAPDEPRKIPTLSRPRSTT